MTTTTDTQQFSTRSAPWMKLGDILEESPRTAAEAARLGGMDFTVSVRPAGFIGTDGEWHDTNYRFAIVRDDTQDLMDYVGKDYRPLQYSQAFEFMDALNPTFIAAGTMRSGRQGFLVADPGITLSPAGDEHRLYAVLRTSHDRSRGIEIMAMPLRGKCMNQLTLRSFVNGVDHRWAIPHNTRMEQKLDVAQAAMLALPDYAEAFDRQAERLTLSHPSEDTARRVLDDALKAGGKRRGQTIDTIINLWHTDEERVGYNDTAWGLINALSEYQDWQKQGGTPESRFQQALQGDHTKALNRVTQAMLALAA